MVNPINPQNPPRLWRETSSPIYMVKAISIFKTSIQISFAGTTELLQHSLWFPTFAIPLMVPDFCNTPYWYAWYPKMIFIQSNCLIKHFTLSHKWNITKTYGTPVVPKILLSKNKTSRFSNVVRTIPIDLLDQNL